MAVSGCALSYSAPLVCAANARTASAPVSTPTRLRRYAEWSLAEKLRAEVHTARTTRPTDAPNARTSGAHGAGQGRKAPSTARAALTRAIAPAQSRFGASASGRQSASPSGTRLTVPLSRPGAALGAFPRSRWQHSGANSGPPWRAPPQVGGGPGTSSRVSTSMAVDNLRLYGQDARRPAPGTPARHPRHPILRTLQ